MPLCLSPSTEIYSAQSGYRPLTFSPLLRTLLLDKPLLISRHGIKMLWYVPNIFQLKRPSHNATNRAIIYLPNFFNFCKQNFLKCTFNIYSNIHVHMYMYNVKSFLSSHLTICCPTPLLETVRLYSISKFPVQEQFLFVSLLPRQASPNSQ